MPEEPTPPSDLPADLGGMNPEELFARGMNSVRITSGGAGNWIPPGVEELSQLFPQYEILSILGRGGMGAVYQARQIALDRLVAIKLLPLEVSVNKDFADRFVREARAMAKLNHPNIISVYDFGKTSEGHLYFVMEFVEGANLYDIIQKEGLDGDQALAIAGQVCTALAYAHGKGVVHRDIKPANVMIDIESQVKVADFGLARLTDPSAEAWRTTMTGVVMGTPDYMAPEQKRGLHVDHRADIYSLGVMLYEMICREAPQGVFEPPSRRAGCDPRIDQIVIRAMQQAPERRYQSTQEMKTDVETARTPRPAAPPPRASAPPPKPQNLPPPPQWPPPPPTASASGNPVLKAAARSAAKKSRLPLYVGIVVVGMVIGVFLWFQARKKTATVPAPASESAVIQPAGPESKAQPPLVNPPGEIWHDWLAESEREGGLPKEFVKEAGGYRVTSARPGKRLYLNCGPSTLKDAGVRVTYLPVSNDANNEICLEVRNTGGATRRIISRGNAGWSGERILSGRITELFRAPHTAAMDSPGWRALELRMVGEVMTFSFNGKVAGAGRDPIPGQGWAGFTVLPGCLIKKVEWADLSGSRPLRSRLLAAWLHRIWLFDVATQSD